MNDLEICKRIAEIEGYRWDYSVGENKRIMLIHEKITTFNPLTDDALCFKLMVKYKVDIVHDARSHEAFIFDQENGLLGASVNKNPNRAICLTIIKAHND